MSMLDLRKTDLRTEVFTNPFVLTSAIIDKEADDKKAVLFSFPKKTKSRIFIPQFVAVETIEVFDGGTIAFTLGTGTIDTNDATTGDKVTTTDADYFITSAAQADLTSLGTAFPDSGAFVTAIAAGDFGASAITCVDTDVPVVYGTLTSDADITAGKCRIHLLGTYLPVY